MNRKLTVDIKFLIPISYHYICMPPKLFGPNIMNIVFTHHVHFHHRFAAM